MARWGGIEPPTPWFVARYSIHLSYQRIEVEYFADLVITSQDKFEHTTDSKNLNGGEGGIRTLDTG